MSRKPEDRLWLLDCLVLEAHLYRKARSKQNDIYQEFKQMTEELTMEKFSVKGLDCAACAAKIEQGLNRLDSVETAVLDFASLTLHVKTSSVSRVLDAVRRIEPQIQLVPKSETRLTGRFRRV